MNSNDNLRKIIEEYETLLEIGVELAGTHDIGKVLGLATVKAEELCGAETGSIWELDESRELLFFRVVRGRAAGEIRSLTMPLGRGIVGHVAATGVAEIVNNVFIFPGVGLGALVSGTPEITDSMFTVAAETLAAEVTEQDLRDGALYPRVLRLREISRRIAKAVVHESARMGLTVAENDDSIKRRIAAAMWEPDYPEIVAS